MMARVRISWSLVARCICSRRRGARAIARPRRAGARARDLARRQARRSPAASTPRRSAGRCRRTPPSRCCASTTARSTRWRCSRDGRIATSGEDARIAIWKPGAPQPVAVLEGHTAPVVALAVSPDGTHARLGVLGSHRAAVAARRRRAARARRPHAERQRRRLHARRHVAWSPPATTRPCASGRSRAARPQIVTLPTPLNTVAVAPDGEIVTAGADGKVYFLAADGRAQRRDRGRRGADHRGRDLRRRQARRRRRHPRLGRDHRSRHAQARAHAGRARPAGVVGGVLPRQPHAAHRRHRSHDPALGCGHRRADRRRCVARRARGSARRLCRRSRRRGVSRLRRLPHAQRRTMASAPARRSPAFSGARSRRCRATISPRRCKKLDIVWTPETVSKLFEVGPNDLHARHQDAGAEDRLARRSRGADAVLGEGDQRTIAAVGAALMPSPFCHPLALLALAQIVLGRAHIRARRRAVGIEVALR